MTSTATQVTVQTDVKAPVEKVWKLFTTPEDIVKWNNASEEWHTPSAENDLQPGGKFVYRMEAKDGSFGFDFNGIYDEVQENKLIAYSLEDGRKVTINFEANGAETKVVETFDTDSSHSADLQRTGWQAILDNFKRYAEAT